jgi:uncharacterized protein with HEPN domain
LFIGQASIDQFLADRRTVYAVTRCLEIISEASRRLPAELKARHPHIRWQGMAGAGNVYRHDYELVLDKAVWDTVHGSLKPLLAVVEEELRRLEGGQAFCIVQLLRVCPLSPRTGRSSFWYKLFE